MCGQEGCGQEERAGQPARIWIDAGKQRFGSFTELNAWLGARCRAQPTSLASRRPKPQARAGGDGEQAGCTAQQSDAAETEHRHLGAPALSWAR